VKKYKLVFCVAIALPLAGQTSDWKGYGGGPENIRYSPLNQITRKNVSQLKVAWTFDSGDAFPGSELQCNPITIDSVLYATTPKLNVIALDAGTGKLIWRFDPNVGRPSAGKMRNRGVAYWSNGSEKRIFFASREFLYSLNAKTGKPDPNFGDAGHLDLRDNLGRNPRDAVTMTSPGIVYKNLLIVGDLMGETLPASPGDIRAYDVLTGKLHWTFHTIPHPGEFGYETWPPKAWTYSGGVNNWTGMALDEKRGLVFVPTGSAAYDFFGGNRTGKNLFANCLLALNAQTGKLVWYFQTVHHDIWDRDLPSPPNLIRIQHDGHLVDAVSQTTKSGWVYVFDRETGKPLFPVSEKPYPASELDGEKTEATQPLPVKPPAFARQILTEDMLTTRTPAAHQAVLTAFKKTRSAGQFIPPSKEGTIIFPGFDGGAEWGGAAFDPTTSHLFVNANEMAWILRMYERPSGAATSGKALYIKECSPCHRPDRSGSPPEFPSLLDVRDHYSDSQIMSLLYDGSGRMPAFARLGDDGLKAVLRYATRGEDEPVAAKAPLPTDSKYINNGYTKFLDPDGYPAVKPPWGTLSSIDLKQGKISWQIPLGEYPELAGQGLRNTGTENYGGPIVTAGGVLFIGATSYDRKFRAFDKETGKLLWETTLPASANATPATYEVNGKQYVVIAAGGGKGHKNDPTSGSYVAFALPDATKP
jgi:quinoprotein glucose dehydrogenase